MIATMKILLSLLSTLPLSTLGFVIVPRGAVASLHHRVRPSVAKAVTKQHVDGDDHNIYTIPLEEISLADLPKVGGYVYHWLRIV